MYTRNTEMRSELRLNSAEFAHGWRVAKWCAEIAAALNLSGQEAESLERAAILHHAPKVTLDRDALQALCTDVGLPNASRFDGDEDSAALEILRALHRLEEAPDSIRRLALILEQCDDLDSACELDARVFLEREMNGLDDLVEEIGSYLRRVGNDEVAAAAAALPVFPAVAHKALSLIGHHDAGFDDLEQVVSADPALAGNIIAAANTALMPSRRASGIREALVRIGLGEARRVVCAASLRSIFSTKHSHSVWNHSLEVAGAAAQIASRSSTVDSEHAFLAGLVHDIGKLAILALPSSVRQAHERLVSEGCPELVVERVVFGESHDRIGARILREWHFDESIAVAVEAHHNPERTVSPLCGVLYLAAEAVRREQVFASSWRRRLASELSSVRPEPLPKMQRAVLDSLRFCA